MNQGEVKRAFFSLDPESEIKSDTFAIHGAVRSMARTRHGNKIAAAGDR